MADTRGMEHLTLTQRISRFESVIAQIETYQKLNGWARQLHLHMRELPQPGNYQLHDMFRTQADEFDAQALTILRGLRKDGWCCQFTPSEQIADLREACEELVA